MASGLPVGLLAQPLAQSQYGIVRPIPARRASLSRCPVARHRSRSQSQHKLLMRHLYASTESGSATDPAIANAVQVLNSAVDGESPPNIDIIKAIQILDKKKLKYTTEEFLQLFGGNPSPGTPWRLVFQVELQELGSEYLLWNMSKDKEAYQAATKGQQASRGFMVPVTAVQFFDASKLSLTNSVFLGYIGGVTLSGTAEAKGNQLQFAFDKLELKLGPFKFAFDSGFGEGIFSFIYVDGQIAVARGISGGMALFAVPSLSWLAERGVVQAV